MAKKKVARVSYKGLCDEMGISYTQVIVAQNASEHSHQAAVFDVLRLLAQHDERYEWAFAIPNGAKLPWTRNRRGKRYSPQAMHLKAEGLTPGVSDVFIPYPVGAYHGLYVEMKRPRTSTGRAQNTPTKQQVDFLRAMRKRGYAGLVCYGAQEAICAIELYLQGVYDASDSRFKIQVD